MYERSVGVECRRVIRRVPPIAVTRGAAVRWGLVVGLWVAAAVWVWALTVAQGPRGPGGAWLGLDSYAYWYAFEHDLYAYDDVVSEGAKTGRYLYSPLFVQALWPLLQLPWPVFAVVWSIAMAAVFWWLLLPLPLKWRVPVFVFLGLEEVILGNVRALIAVALVAALRRPIMWTIPALTKLASAVGILWHVFRGEWRHVVAAGAYVAFFVSVSWLMSPELWRGWIAFLADAPISPPGGYATLLFRGMVAVGLVLVGVWQRNPAWLAPATALAAPVIYLADLSFLSAVPRLHQQRETVSAKEAMPHERVTSDDG